MAGQRVRASSTRVLICMMGVVCLPALAVAQSAPASTARVAGVVVTTHGTSVADAVVRLLADKDNLFVSDEVKSNEKGRFEIDGVPAGKYVGRVEADGFEPYIGTVVVASGADVIFTPRLREREFFFQFGPNSGIDLTLIQVGSYIFYDVGGDDPGEIDLYKDGKASISLQLAGVDLVLHRSRATGARVGFNTGMALVGSSQTVTPVSTNGATSSTDSTDYGSVFVWSASAFLDIAKVVRVEFGHAMGISAKEGLTRGQSNDSAWFIGLSVKSSLGDLVKKLR
ncbi:MAG: carboxypeptidase regulatory-like domain-containing protein [Acidobacteria bacterium]|nr:carboxypeptidase regulatory-like domain-containing protein [Acidobacteriota bacterium]